MSELVTYTGSQSLYSLEYVAETRTLYALFLSGHAYVYDQIPPAVWFVLRAETRAIGRVFDNLVRRGHYPYERLDVYQPQADALQMIRHQEARRTCPGCGSGAVIISGGQVICSSCGHGNTGTATRRRKVASR